jgi:hypothetical protein
MPRWILSIYGSHNDTLDSSDRVSHGKILRGHLIYGMYREIGEHPEFFLGWGVNPEAIHNLRLILKIML